MTANEIRKQAAEWDAANEEQKAKHEAQYQAYRAAEREAMSGIDSHIREKLDGINLPFEIRIERRFGDGIEVRVSAYDLGMHETETTALRWHWTAQSGNGGIKKESGSWSGLEATNEAQLEDLRQTVKALETLNSIEWETLLDVTLPEYGDYVTESRDNGPRPNFDQQIKEAELRELVGTDKLIKGTESNGRGIRWYMIVKETPKLYEIRSVGDYYLEGKTIEQIKGYYTERVTKEKFTKWINLPIETREIA